MFKKICSVILVSTLALSLSACGGVADKSDNGGKSAKNANNYTEMVNDEAKSVLELKFSKYEILEGYNYKSLGYSLGTGGVYIVRTYHDIVVKDEYKNDYMIDKILTYDLNESDELKIRLHRDDLLKYNSSGGAKDAKFEIDRENCQFIADWNTFTSREAFEVVGYRNDINGYDSIENIRKILDTKKGFNEILEQRTQSYVHDSINNIRVSFIKLR